MKRPMHDDAALICEIFDGLTPISFGGEKLFLRHINLRDQRILSVSFEQQKQRAIDSGVPIEKDVLDKLKAENHWTEDDDVKIQEKRDYIKNLLQTKSQFDFPSQKADIQKTIDAENEELNKILSRRRELVGKTAEDFGVIRSNEEFIRNILYKDELLKELKFSDREFGELDDLSELIGKYHELSEKMSDEKIQEATLSDSFSLYLSQTDKPYDFFARPIISLSIYQLKLLAYGRMFSNIFQNVENIPENIKKSPKELLDFVDTQRKRQKEPEGNHKSVGMVGATKDDLKYYDPSAKNVDFAAELKKNGGKMDATQIAKLLNG